MRKKQYLVRPDEVVIWRTAKGVEVHYKEPGVPATVYTGGDLLQMSDIEIVDFFNAGLRARERLAAEHKHVAVEVPPGSPQIKYEPRADQWTPRGSVVRCIVGDDENGDPLVEIDDQELSMEAFGKLLLTYAGWGMRIEFTPEDEVHRRPALEVREPEAEPKG